MQTMTLVLCLLQVAGGATSAPSNAPQQGDTQGFASDSSEGNAKVRTRTATPVRNDFALYIDERNNWEEQQFVARFNNLVKALRDFASVYQPGLLIDVKKVKAVRKAMHGLEKSGWFRPQKED
jgi:hypothetical protein